MIGNNLIKDKRGLSLIETIVYIAIFSVFIFLVFDIINISNKLNSKTKNISIIESNITPVFDSLLKNIEKNGINYEKYKSRNGYTINSPRNNISLNNNIIYKLTSNCYDNNNSCIEFSSDNGSSFLRITDKNINIYSFDFYFNPPSDTTMPIVTIVYDGEIKENNENTKFFLQDTIEIKGYLNESN